MYPMVCATALRPAAPQHDEDGGRRIGVDRERFSRPPGRRDLAWCRLGPGVL